MTRPAPAVFLDRDGTVIYDRDYLGDPAGVELVPGAAAAISRLNAAGIPVVLITNQSGIGRGYFGVPEYEAVQRRLGDLLAEHGARLDAVYYCPHAPDARPPCDCRKPAVGLYQRAARDHGLDLARSWYVGDRVRDLSAATRFGGTGVLVPSTGVREPECAPAGVLTAATIGDAVERVLAEIAD